jgi:hypothetical protein
VVHKISIPGATRLEVIFDERSRTESGCDYVRFYTPNSTQVGEEKYTGRGDSNRWAGVGRTPKLEVQGSELEARFHSDGSENDWGYKFTVLGYLADDGLPVLRQRLSKPLVHSICMYCMHELDGVKEPKKLLLETLDCLEKLASDKEMFQVCSQYFASCHSSSLRHFVCKIMHTLHSSTPAFCSLAAVKSVSQKLLGSNAQLDLEMSLCSLLTLQQSAPKRIAFESPHPYPDDSDSVHKISIPGAVRLEIAFDPQSRTESGCDYVRFVLPDGRVVGDDKYTGRGGSAHWAGVGSIPALIVEGSEVEARFHSDGSTNDWG